MRYVRLGTTGLNVSPICLGMMSYGDPSWRDWIIPESDAEPFVRLAADSGVNFFDTADVYSNGVSEEITGRLLKKVFSRREDYVVATKVFFPVGTSANDSGLSRGHILDAVDASLRRLDLDHIDLYQIHRWDPDTPIEETMEALDYCVQSGRVRYIGASSMPAWQFGKAQHVAASNGWSRFVTMQNHYNLLYREEEREMIPQCLDMGVGLIPWSPQARGLLTRPRSGDADTTRGATDAFTGAWYTDSNHEIIDVVEAIAGERGVSMSQVALAWLMSRPGVTAPIIGATRVPHLEEAVGAVEVTLSDQEVKRLEEPYSSRPIAEY